MDRQLKHEAKHCMEELQCNLVVMKQARPKVLRLNLTGSSKKETEVASLLEPISEASEGYLKSKHDDMPNVLRGPVVTPASSPEHGTTFTSTDIGTSSMSSSDPGNSPFFFPRISRDLKMEDALTQLLDESESDADSEKRGPQARLCFQRWLVENILSSGGELSKHLVEGSRKVSDKAVAFKSGNLKDRYSQIGPEPEVGVLNYKFDLESSINVREIISLSSNAPPGPPPLCSICQHKGPVFGKPPRWFTYAELELATDGFSHVNFLAEGGFGSVHRGILPDGQVVAVKQHKLASSQGDLEFCSEVEVLSCAQHRNVVMLIGFCVEDGRRLLVYEYICNGSLDSYLYGKLSSILYIT